MNFIERLKHPHWRKYGAHEKWLMATSCTAAIRKVICLVFTSALLYR